MSKKEERCQKNLAAYYAEFIIILYEFKKGNNNTGQKSYYIFSAKINLKLALHVAIEFFLI